MSYALVMIAVILFLCIIAERFSGKMGMPALILFMCLGMLFGSDGILKIPFENYDIAEKICTISLSVIMFYGGFNTKWETARPIAKEAVLLSTLGVIGTTLLTAGFCYLVFDMSFAESFPGRSSTRFDGCGKRILHLKKEKTESEKWNGIASEIESGSNDPFAYMLTIIGLSLIRGESLSSIPYMVFAQLVYGIAIGVAVAFAGIVILTKTKLIAEGLDTIFVIGLVLAAYALPACIGGNGFLSVYLMGIILGNSKIRNKQVLIPFFDGVTGLAQILIFFLLGLLAFPHKIPAVIPMAVLVALFMMLVARPVVVFLLMKPFGAGVRQCLLVSWSGLRGAASIVFAIFIVAGGSQLSYDLYHIVFMVSLISVALQGALLPKVSEKLGMVDAASDVRRTFNDYQDESLLTMMQLHIPAGHNWENKLLEEAHMPQDSLVLMIKRNGETIIPKGNTKILADDSLIFSVPSYHSGEDVHLEEIRITEKHAWKNQAIESLELPKEMLIALIKRGDENVIPQGKTVIHEGDIVVLCR